MKKIFAITEWLLKKAGEIPQEFNSELYLKFNSDVQKSHLIPAIHFYKYGQYLSSPFSLPKIIQTEFYDPAKLDNALIILGHNKDKMLPDIQLCEFLARKYNVLAVILNKELNYHQLEKYCAFVCIAEQMNTEFTYTKDFFIKIANEYRLKYIFLKNISSYAILDNLCTFEVAIVSLIDDISTFDLLTVKRNQKLASTVLFNLETTPNVYSLYLLNKLASINACTINELEENSKLLITTTNSKIKNEFLCEIELQAEKATSLVENENSDIDIILRSNLFDLNYYSPHRHKSFSTRDMIKDFVKSWQAETDLRKPFAGFHPGIYEEMHGKSSLQANALADYIRAGLPQGPWRYPVIDGNNKAIPDCVLTVALHLHVHYVELLEPILEKIKFNNTKIDLFVSVTSVSKLKAVLSVLSKYNLTISALEIVPNIGRDIGSFLTWFLPKAINQYDILGHIHTKKSIHLNARIANNWNLFLIENMLGDKDCQMVDIAVDYFASHPEIGIIYPDDPNVFGWSKNKLIAKEILQKITSVNLINENINFPAGSMFWGKAAALTPLQKLNYQWEDYPKEPLLTDGTTLHAIERILPLIIKTKNYKYATSSRNNISR